jgi:hypothetical protein
MKGPYHYEQVIRSGENNQITVWFRIGNADDDFVMEVEEEERAITITRSYNTQWLINLRQNRKFKFPGLEILSLPS